MSEDIATVRAGFDALVGEGAAVLLEREIISVQGPDAGRYLQGQLSQDVMTMAGSSAWSFILQPTGRVDAWLRVHRLADDDFRLEIEPGLGEALIARLRKFLIRTKATISEPVSGSLIARRWAPATIRLGDDLLDALPGVPVGPGVAGADSLLFVEIAIARVQLDLREAPVASLERYRIAHGVPAMGTELTTDTIPGEAGGWVIDDSVSFTKGCYTGQELVARIDSRGGNVPKPIRLLVVGGDTSAEGEVPTIGSEIFFNGTLVGRITSSCSSLGDGYPAMALAPLARAVEFGSVVELRDGDRLHSAVVTEPPAAN
jgi:folate-binding protein YgfZ